MTVIAGQVCMHNEVDKGNLDRCLENLSRYCDLIIVYDDGSTDNSVEVALRYTPYVIRGEVNDQMNELAHKQLIMDKAIELGATHLFWLDCDEVLDRQGTTWGLRSLCASWPEDLDAYSFRELNLWRSQTWVRIDSLFTVGRFVRLWKVQPGIRFKIEYGVHKQLYPITIKEIREAPYGVIHYGFWDYKQMLVKIGAAEFTQEQLEDNAKTNWILNESECSCYRLADDIFPPGSLAPDLWIQPQPRPITSLQVYKDLPDEPQFPLVDHKMRQEWAGFHQNGYHGTYDKVLARNREVWKNSVKPLHRASLFRFDPKDKVVLDWGCGGGWFMLDCIKAGAAQVIGLEVDAGLIDMARKSFEELAIPPETYQFINLQDDLTTLPPLDAVYCVAVFMHLPLWQVLRQLRAIHGLLKPGGMAYLQFYQKGDGLTMFYNSVDSVTTIRLNSELAHAGFKIITKFLAEGEGVLPVWQMYACQKT